MSPECMDFMMSFVCESSSRLGRRNVDEIKNHPWFASVVSTRKGKARAGGLGSRLGAEIPHLPLWRRYLGVACCMSTWEHLTVSTCGC